MPVPLEL